MQTAVLARPKHLSWSKRCSLARIAANRAVKLCRLMLACAFGTAAAAVPASDPSLAIAASSAPTVQ